MKNHRMHVFARTYSMPASPSAVDVIAPPPLAAWRRLLILLVAAQCLALVLLGAMLLNEHRGLLRELTLSRIEIQAGDLEAALRTGALTGLRPDEIHNLDAMVARLKKADPAIADIEVAMVDGDIARVVSASTPSRMAAVLTSEEWRSMRSLRDSSHVRSASGTTIAASIRDAADDVVGGLRVGVAAAVLQREERRIAGLLWPRIAAAIAVMILITLAALGWLRSSGTGGPWLRRRVMAVALLTTFAAGVQVAWNAKGLLEATLTPVLTSKVEMVAELLAGKLARAEALGIPLDKLPGVDAYFDGVIAKHPGVAALKLIDNVGATLARQGVTTGDWIEHAAGSGRIAVAADGEFVARRLGELGADVGIVLLVAVVVFRELLRALLVGLPGGGESTAERLQSLRLPLFLFILTEEMSRSFLPLYIKSFATGESFLGSETEIGLPIAIYMLFFALATPFAGRWADRWGIARVFAAGVGLTLLGFLWTALAGSYWELLPARALCAWGYATGTMACQRQLIVLTSRADRARGLALFVGAVGIAAICGSALGGVLADQFGFRPVFAVSALLGLLALVIFRLTQRGSNEHHEAIPPLRMSEIRRLLMNRRFAALMLGGAVPAKIALAGFLFYLAPLTLHQLDYSPAEIGRAVMVYFILVSTINPVASWLSDRYRWRLSLTLVGGGVIGLGGLAGLGAWLFGEMNSVWLVWIGILTLGIGTGLASAPMQALATEIGARTGATSVAVMLRTLERLGSFVGPLWAGVWLATTGWGGAMAAIGVVVLAGTLVCLAARESR